MCGSFDTRLGIQLNTVINLLDDLRGALNHTWLGVDGAPPSDYELQDLERAARVRQLLLLFRGDVERVRHLANLQRAATATYRERAPARSPADAAHGGAGIRAEDLGGRDALEKAKRIKVKPTKRRVRRCGMIAPPLFGGRCARRRGSTRRSR